MPGNTLSGLSLRDLEYAVAVAEQRHFGRAAERCGVSQAGLSEQVRKLEDLLGVALFERSTRRISITPEGVALLGQARDVLGAARVLLETARSQTEPLSGPLRLGVIATLGPYYLPDLLRQVRRRFAKLELRLQEGLTHALAHALQRGELDAVLLALPLQAEGLIMVPLFFEPFRAVFPAGHPLAKRRHLRVQDLAEHGLLLLEEGHCLRDQALSLCGSLGTKGKTRFASSLEMLRHMIAAGEGYSLLPLLATQENGASQDLMEIRPLGDENAGRTIGLAWRRTDPRKSTFQEFVDFLRSTAPAGTRVLRSPDVNKTD